VILVDTSVWIEHLRKGSAKLKELLERELAATHPFVIGELACGGLKRRREFLADIAVLPCLPQADQSEVLEFVEGHRLWSKGLGWVDVHLLAAALLSNCSIWTLDKALAGAADALSVGA
jgi:predicted nucleic acid-binding protein